MEAVLQTWLAAVYLRCCSRTGKKRTLCTQFIQRWSSCWRRSALQPLILFSSHKAYEIFRTHGCRMLQYNVVVVAKTLQAQTLKCNKAATAAKKQKINKKAAVAVATAQKQSEDDHTTRAPVPKLSYRSECMWCPRIRCQQCRWRLTVWLPYKTLWLLLLLIHRLAAVGRQATYTRTRGIRAEALANRVIKHKYR